MEEAILRYYPAILEDSEYLKRRPIGMAYEKVEGYEVILQEAGFSDIQVTRETKTFVSADEDEWWRQMRNLGWDPFIKKIEEVPDQLERVMGAIFGDLRPYKRADGIHFDKVVFFVRGVK